MEQRPSDHGTPPATGRPADLLLLENEHFVLGVDRSSGAIASLKVKDNDCELIGEPRLAANFRLCLPLPDYQCNYIEGMNHDPASVDLFDDRVQVHFSGLSSGKARYPVDLTYTITLAGDQVIFRARLTNHHEFPISEFWFPRLGGWTRFGAENSAALAVPGYFNNCSHNVPIFQNFPSGRGLGAEAAEWSTDYPGMTMPWWDLYDADSDCALYLGYHDQTFRISTWHAWLFPDSAESSGGAWLSHEQAAGDPVGLVFSHVRYPFIKQGETFETGDFIIRVHRGDWHQGSQCYRQWFLQHFPVDKSRSWLRRQSAWFTSILYQPEDKITADYKTYDQWTKDAQDLAGIRCNELIGWDSGGIERNYPDYVPEQKLGGKQGFRELMRSISARGAYVLAFANYNVLDSASQWYEQELHKFTHQDQFGKTPNWMAWGESTLIARKGMSVRRHLLASVVPPLEKILHDRFVEIARDGAHGLQIDKLCVGSALDFNPLNTMKPDTALCEGLVQSVARALDQCRRVNPEFCFAAEAGLDRLIPYVDVGYRNTMGFEISPLHFVFPEWTSCQHVSGPLDFNGVNGAVVTGSVICVEPSFYQGTLAEPRYRKLAEYIREVERIRRQLTSLIFTGRYYDTLDARIVDVSGENAATPEAADHRKIGGEVMIPGGGASQAPATAGGLHHKVHGDWEGKQRVIIVANATGSPKDYRWQFTHRDVARAALYEPFEDVRTVNGDTPLQIKSHGLHILVEVID